MEPIYDVVWPRSPRGVQAQRTAPRLASLDGKRIGFVSDYLFRSDELFPALADEFRRRFTDIDIVDCDAFGNIHGPDEAVLVAALPAALKDRHVDAVICGNGC